MELSIHDNELIRYTVDSQARTIRLETAYPHSNSPELTNVEFGGVSAYHFENGSFELGTILFGIEEINAGDFIERYSDLFLAGRPNCWPGEWNKSNATMLLHIETSGLRAWTIDSSIGLCGWVLAKSFSLSPAEAKK
jgi:hypothetical protein